MAFFIMSCSPWCVCLLSPPCGCWCIFLPRVLLSLVLGWFPPSFPLDTPLVVWVGARVKHLPRGGGATFFFPRRRETFSPPVVVFRGGPLLGYFSPPGSGVISSPRVLPGGPSGAPHGGSASLSPPSCWSRPPLPPFWTFGAGAPWRGFVPPPRDLVPFCVPPRGLFLPGPERLISGDPTFNGP